MHSQMPIPIYYSHFELDNSTFGIANIGRMCSRSLSVGVTRDTGHSEDFEGATAAHVLGHILNMRHDDNGESGCMYMCVVLFLASMCVSQFDISVIFVRTCIYDNGESGFMYMCVLFSASTCVSQFDISVVVGCKYVHVHVTVYAKTDHKSAKIF